MIVKFKDVKLYPAQKNLSAIIICSDLFIRIIHVLLCICHPSFYFLIFLKSDPSMFSMRESQVGLPNSNNVVVSILFAAF